MHSISFDRIELQPNKTLIGMNSKMSLASDGTAALWQRFMPRRGEIGHARGPALYSVQSYSGLEVFDNFTPQTEFEKWAAIAVEDVADVPEGMQQFVLRGGNYAVFDHRGPPSEFPKSAQYIFGEWLPVSEWQIDDREHFEVLLPGWRADDPEAQEEVWIPVRAK